MPRERVQFLTPDQVAVETQVSRRTVMRAIARGELEASQLARRGVWRIHPAAVDRWVDRRSTCTPATAPSARRGIRGDRLVVAVGMGRTG